MKNITVILGPTGIGKSKYAIDLAQQSGAEIISADAFQVYKEFDVGTAKVSLAEQQLVPHHLIDTLTPTTPYSVVQFQQEALSLVQTLTEQKKPIIICGGTAYYLMSFLYNYDFSQSPKSDPIVRAKLEDRLLIEGKDLLLCELKQIDPVLYEKIDQGNPRRLIRALEIFELTGKPPSSFKIEGPLRQDCTIIGLTTDRDTVYDKINTRVDKMIQNGLIEEVSYLLTKFPKTAPAFQALGYKQCIEFLEGKCDKDNTIDQIKTLTRRFAKRQLTWFKRIENVKWI